MLSHGTSLHSINFTSTSLNCEKWQNPRATAYIQHHLRQTGKTENKNHMIWQPGPNYRLNLIAIHWEKHSQGITFLHKCPFSLSYNKSTVSVLHILVWTTSKLKVKVISQNALLTSVQNAFFFLNGEQEMLQFWNYSTPCHIQIHNLKSVQ